MKKSPTSRYSQRRDLSRRVRSNEKPNDSHEIQNRITHAARQLPSWLTFDVGRKRMHLLPYPEFEALKLRSIVGVRREVEAVTGQEWMGGIWKGEAIGFTGFWSLEDETDRVGGIEVDFSELDEEEKRELKRVLQLPLRHGMSLADVQSAFGTPKAMHRFVSDRAAYDFAVGSEWPYHLSCTVHETNGLIHFALLRENAFQRCIVE